MGRWMLVALSWWAGCATAPTSDAVVDDDAVDVGPSWHADIGPLLQRRCGGCHVEGGIGPWAFTTYDEVVPRAAAIRASVAAGSMPPWPPSDDCNTYAHHRGLEDDELDTLLDWLDGDMPEGAPEDARVADDGDDVLAWDADVELVLPEAYTPEPGDDYRCQLIRWPLDEPGYITGLRVVPDAQAIVHHAILFAANADGADRYEALDEADEGPGWTCFGGPDGGDMGEYIDSLSLSDGLGVIERLRKGEVSDDDDLPFGVLFGADGGRWIGEWVPGEAGVVMAEGSGIRMDPGDVIMAQMHYNTLGKEPVPDRSSIAFRVEETVEREGWVVPVMDLGWLTEYPLLGPSMTIPAGDPEVTHATKTSTTQLAFAAARHRLGVADDEPLILHGVGHHMHQLGSSARISVEHAGGASECLLEIPEWDFGWQGGYLLEQSVTLRPDDEIGLSCTWDNSAANQIVVDGEQLEPRDVSWGDRTTDEMCLGILYVTGP